MALLPKKMACGELPAECQRWTTWICGLEDVATASLIGSRLCATQIMVHAACEAMEVEGQGFQVADVELMVAWQVLHSPVWTQAESILLF